MTRVLIGGRGKQRRQNQGDSSTRRTPRRFLTLGVEEGATGPGVRAALEAGKGEGRFSPGASRGTQPWRHGFIPVKPVRAVIQKGVVSQAAEVW